MLKVQSFNGEDEFLGLITPASKSAPLLLVSVHPLLNLKIDVVVEGAGVAEVPSKVVAVPNPTKSITEESVLRRL